MDTNFFVWFFVGLVGAVLLAATTVGAFVWLKKMAKSAILYLLGDEKIAEAGARLILFLVAFEGIASVLGIVSQSHLTFLFSSWVRLAHSIFGVVQWAIQIAALLFIGFAIKGRKSD
jgi:hypothetical protein